MGLHIQHRCLLVFKLKEYGHNENLWGLRGHEWRGKREGGHGYACVSVLICVGKGQSWFYLNKIVYVTVMFTVPVAERKRKG